MSTPPGKGPGEARKTGEARERPVAGSDLPDTVHLLGSYTRQGAHMEGLAAEKSEARLESVRARLESGALDRPEIFYKTAERILRGRA